MPKSFQRVATLANYLNNGEDATEETVSEIIAATANGRTLVYTDAIRGTIGFIDIADSRRPQPLGTLALDPNPDDDRLQPDVGGHAREPLRPGRRRHTSGRLRRTRAAR